MTVGEVLGRIRELMEERNWSLYKLATQSGLAPSSLYNMFERETMPKIETLDKICTGLGISLSDFFAFNAVPHEGGYITDGDALLLAINHKLPQRSRERLLAYAQGIYEEKSDT